MLNRLRPTTLRCSLMAVQAQRTYLAELGLDSHAIVQRQEAGKEAGNLELWREQTKKNALVLSTNDEIESYVLSIVRDYFRTTKKAAVSLDSLFVDHGLDSLDAIEFVIRIEDELGYLIEAENLELFKKPRHFVNFIKQLEAYKTEFNKLPHENTKWHFSMQEAFPGLPKMGH
jgi:acyl carrier protein